MKILFYILLILIVLFGISFAALNAELVTIRYYVGSKQLPLSFLLALCFSLGALLGWLSSLGLFLRAKRKIFKLKNQLNHATTTTPLTPPNNPI